MTRRAFVGACGLAISAAWNIANVGAVATSLAPAYGISLGTVGLFTTVLLLAHALIQIPGGRAYDRFGARRVGFIGLAVLVLANALALIAPEPALALTIRALAGVGTGITFIAGSSQPPPIRSR